MHVISCDHAMYHSLVVCNEIGRVAVVKLKHLAPNMGPDNNPKVEEDDI